MTTFDPDAAAPEGSGVFGLPHSVDEARVVLVPVPFEATTSYGGGAADGPRAILEASRQIDLFDAELGPFHEVGIAMLPEAPEVRRWNREAKAAARPIVAKGGAGTPALQKKLALVNDRSAKLNGWVRRTTEGLLARGKLVGIVGGDHAVPLGAIAAAAARSPGLGILHFDAHADLRVAYEGFRYSHASIHYNVAEEIEEVSRIVQLGIRDVGRREVEYAEASGGRIVTNFAHDTFARLHAGTPFTKLCGELLAPLPERVWLSFDIDGFEPHLCPHTGTPVPGGFEFLQVVTLLRTLVATGRTIVGFDLCEVAPGPDDEWDGNVGARLLYKMIGFALASQAKPARRRR